MDIAQVAQSEREAYIAQLHAEDVATRLAVRHRDKVLGGIAFQVNDGAIAVHVGQVLDLFRDRMDAAQFAKLRQSGAAETFVSLDTMNAMGVPLKYDAVYDELVLGTLPG